MRPDTLVLYAIRQVGIHRPNRAAPADAKAGAGLDLSSAPAIGCSPQIVEYRSAPLATEPVLVLGAGGRQIFGWIDGAVLLVAYTQVTITAHGFIPTGTEQQRRRHFRTGAFGKHRA